MKSLFCALALGCAVAAASTPAAADVLFDTGFNGTIGGYTFSAGSGYRVAGRFTLANDAEVNGADLGVWRDPGATVSGFNWAIFDAAPSTGGAVLASGASSVDSSTPVTGPGIGYGFYDVATMTFSFTGVNLLAGDYYLQVEALSDGGVAYLDIVRGADTDLQQCCFSGGSWHDLDPDQGSFRVLGVSSSTGGVPEPASWALMIAGFGLAGGVLRRRAAVAG